MYQFFCVIACRNNECCMSFVCYVLKVYFWVFHTSFIFIFANKKCFTALMMLPALSGANFCWAMGGIICNFTPILPYFQHWGGWTSTKTLFRWANLVKTKKKVFIRNGTLFLSTDLRSDAHQSQIIGGDADEDHSQIVGGYTVKLLGGIYPPIPPWFRHHYPHWGAKR